MRIKKSYNISDLHFEQQQIKKNVNNPKILAGSSINWRKFDYGRMRSEENKEWYDLKIKKWKLTHATKRPIGKSKREKERGRDLKKYSDDPFPCHQYNNYSCISCRFRATALYAPFGHISTFSKSTFSFPGKCSGDIVYCHRFNNKFFLKLSQLISSVLQASESFVLRLGRFQGMTRNNFWVFLYIETVNTLVNIHFGEVGQTDHLQNFAPWKSGK